MFNLTKREQIIIITAMVSIAGAIGAMMIHNSKRDKIQINTGDLAPAYAQPVSEHIPSDTEKKDQEIIVDVKGSVNNPGIAVLEKGKRIYDAIEAAGGIKDDADLEVINLAAYLKDGQCIYIPKKGEKIDEDIILSPQSGNDLKININTADVDKLSELPGVGPATAKKIIDFREQYSDFKEIEDIMKVPGIGEKKFEQIKDLIDI